MIRSYKKICFESSIIPKPSGHLETFFSLSEQRALMTQSRTCQIFCSPSTKHSCQCHLRLRTGYQLHRLPRPMPNHSSQCLQRGLVGLSRLLPWSIISNKVAMDNMETRLSLSEDTCRATIFGTLSLLPDTLRRFLQCQMSCHRSITILSLSKNLRKVSLTPNLPPSII